MKFEVSSLLRECGSSLLRDSRFVTKCPIIATTFLNTAPHLINSLLQLWHFYVICGALNNFSCNFQLQPVVLSLQFLWLIISYAHERHSSCQLLVKGSAQCSTLLTKILPLLYFLCFVWRVEKWSIANFRINKTR